MVCSAQVEICGPGSSFFFLFPRLSFGVDGKCVPAVPLPLVKCQTWRVVSYGKKNKNGMEE